MAWIPETEFQSPFARNKREQERIPAFRLDKEPVSRAAYLAFVRSHAGWRRSRVGRLFTDSTYLTSWNGDFQPPSPLEEPVTQVSWFAAKAYCSSLGKRLPATAEWERAILQIPAGMDSAVYFSQILKWYSSPHGPADGKRATAGSRNAYGIRNLFGKVWEWTADFNTAGPSERGELSAKDASFYCGGAAASAAPGTDYATFMRYAFRSSLKPDFTVGALGFRCAQDAP